MSVIVIRRLLPVCLAALMIAWLPAAEPDGETVSFSAPSKVGAVVVPPGLYRLKVQGALVFFTDVATKKSFSALVRLEKMAKRSSFTAAQAKPIEGGQQQVDAIVMQGLDYKLVF
jgi:hypothetical protein